MVERAEAGGVPAMTFRPDIEGLRAVAVGLVVALHAGVTALSASAIASKSAAPFVRAATFFKSAFIFEKASSMGLRSGE